MGPVGEERTSLQIRRGHRPPEAAVVGVVAVVSEGKIGLRRHGERGGLVTPTQPFRKLRLVRPDARVGVERSRLVLLPAVDEDGLVADFHRVRGKRHGPLDEIPPRVLRELENDDVAAAHRAAGKQPIDARGLKTLVETLKLTLETDPAMRKEDVNNRVQAEIMGAMIRNEGEAKAGLRSMRSYKARARAVSVSDVSETEDAATEVPDEFSQMTDRILERVEVEGESEST